VIQCKLPTPEVIIKPKNLEEKNIGSVWKIFNNLMGNQGKYRDEIYQNRGHICEVLKGIGFTFYFYELIDYYTEEQLEIFNHIRLVLDKVLACNQFSSRILKFILHSSGWLGDIFPRFFNEFDQKEIAKWSYQIEKEIEKASNMKFVYNKIERDDYWDIILNPKDEFDLLDIKGCYGELLSIFNTLKPNLPKENISIIDDLISRCEHGYFLGFLLEKTFKKYKQKVEKSPKRSKGYLRKRLMDFRKGREQRVLLASKEIFEPCDILDKKLKKIFEFEKV
jgi:hypothetical protein